ncbi:MAG: cysteine desulfurase [Actinomycetota bacterium]|nr:cysteine desulfurase [Actinomycetota bacterium]
MRPGLRSLVGMPAYFDNAATTAMRAEAVEAMLPFLRERFGNPSGSHALAREARKALDEARDVVAGCLGAEPGEVVFTGGGTEADNLAVAGSHRLRGGTVVCSAVEHHAVLHACADLGGRLAPVTADGVVDLDRLAEVLDADVTVVAVMLVNNEVGTVQPLADIADVVRRLAPSAVLHTDAVAAFSWIDVAAVARVADLVAVSAHKFGGPKGVGALVVRQPVKVAPILYGGGQERDRRSGTHNVAGIVAMAAAMQAAVAERADVVARVGALRDRLADGLLAAVPESRETGRRDTKVAGNCHISFTGVESEALLMLLDGAGVYASAGSACASGAVEPSHVLAAMGVPRDRALGSLRLTLGRDTTAADVDLALAVIPPAVARLRNAAQ